MVDNEGRPNPDSLLKAVQDQELKTRKGRLRVFLGMSAGVGKTYAMLKAAHQRLKEGVDVVIGVVETHGRNETAALVENLPLLPRAQINYRGTSVDEMDFEGILKRKPQLVLVDELAHTNAPGSRHLKRYQDVLELLDRGIDVYTTINVQHLESRKEAVEGIAQIQIRETVPDSILERAYLVELVDIAPSELLKRLREGKVYLGDKAQRASENFFKEDRLTALREIALRLTAERVDQDLQRLSINGQRAWQTNERLMVAISHSPFSESLIRATRRIAYNLEAPWLAVYVDTGATLSKEDQDQLTKNINLARELKAEVLTTTDTDIVDALKRVAVQKNVTQIVLGRPTKRLLQDFIEGGTLLDRLVREGGDIDVHVIRQNDREDHRTFLQRFPLFKSFGPVQAYWFTVWFLIGVGVLGFFVEPLIGYRAVGYLFLLGVLIVGMMATMGPIVMAAVVSALGWNFFFIPPRFTFDISRADDLAMTLSYLVVASITGYLAHRVRSHEKIIREREDRISTLYEVSQDIAASFEKKEFLEKINERMGRLLDGSCGILLKGKDGKLLVEENKSYSFGLKDKEKAVAAWAFESGKKAGWSTDTLSEAKNLYIPLKASTSIVGIFIYRPNKKRKLTLEQESLLLTVLNQLANSLEKHFLEKRLRETEKLEESEHLHQTLLSSISHELRTPLTVIMGTASAFADPAVSQNPVQVMAMGEELSVASERLNRIIENLLDMSRLSSGVLALKKEWQDVRDLVGVSLGKLKGFLTNHPVQVQIPDDFPLVQMDFRLMEHAVMNLILNAASYTPPGTTIFVSARLGEESLEIEVRDDGQGIPEESIPLLFDKFYRVPGTKTGGTGLGLSIVKSIIEAHKGTVSVANTEPHGACFTITLPWVENKKAPKEEDIL